MSTDNRGEKLQKVYIVINICLLFGIDYFIIKYAYYSANDWLVELGKKKIVALIIGNIAALVLIIKQDAWRKKCQNSLLIKVVNRLSLLMGPLLCFCMLQTIISDDGKFIVQREYIIKNIIVYYIIYILFLLLCWKVSVAISLYTFFLVLLGLIDYFVTLFRGNAFVLMDVFSVGTASAVVDNYVFALPTKVGLSILILFLFVLYQEVFQTIQIGSKNWKIYLLRIALFFIAVFFIFINAEIYFSEKVEMWYTSTEYQTKGYLYELACEIQYVEVKKPEQYSVENVKRIVANVQNEKLDESSTIIPQNIIVIMNESLADFESCNNFKASTEILSNIHSLQKNTKKGYLYVPSFGGGTADSEYEVLTGNTKEFLPQGAVAYQLYCRDPEFGMANTLVQEGYSTMALHPFYERGWNRSSVYSDMNFGDFISIENWNEELEYIRWYASDSSTFNKLINICQERKDEKNFLFCVTMQNHGGYTESESAGYQPEVSLEYDENYPLAEMYLSLAKKSDEAFGELIDHFENIEEPTMIVMFGDHWPNLENGFLSELLGQDASALDLVGLQECRRTPYVIWTNYTSESESQDMSANYFGSYIMHAAGCELTDYNRFLLQLKQKLPIIGTGEVCDSNGNWYSMDSLPEEYENLLNDYRILQYNNITDRKNRISDIFQLAN